MQWDQATLLNFKETLNIRSALLLLKKETQQMLKSLYS